MVVQLARLQQALAARTDEASKLAQRVAAAQSAAQASEQRHKQEVLRWAKEIERLKAVIAEHPAAVEQAVKEKTSELQEEREACMRQLGLLKGMVKSREVERKAREVDVVKLEHKLLVQNQKGGGGSSASPPAASRRVPQQHTPFR
jgi:uncharacterized protein YhaN